MHVALLAGVYVIKRTADIFSHPGVEVSKGSDNLIGKFHAGTFFASW